MYLHRAIFEGADLKYSTFIEADLQGAYLMGADASHANFTDASLINGIPQRSKPWRVCF
ncbi:pentapeptide repeat-containing protein [Tunturiibacter gelidoferens]